MKHVESFPEALVLTAWSKLLPIASAECIIRHYGTFFNCGSNATIIRNCLALIKIGAL